MLVTIFVCAAVAYVSILDPQIDRTVSLKSFEQFLFFNSSILERKSIIRLYRYIKPTPKIFMEKPDCDLFF